MKAGVLVSQQPPEPIQEVPPQIRPEGDDVAWVPGYWAWDDEAKSYLWLSGVWRKTPPGTRWLPGYWSHVADSYRWVPGAWIAANAAAVSYLPISEAASLERGPVGQAPSAASIWIPGLWVYQDARYQWRPGYWTKGHDNWMWIPDHYVYTPHGAIFVQGYWDYRLTDRGLLFAPVRFSGGLGVAGQFTPQAVVDPQALFLHLFVRPDYHHYYFGDYYDAKYAALGIHPWWQYHDTARGWDPMLSFYLWSEARNGVDLTARLTGWHSFFMAHVAARPAATLAGAGAGGLRHVGRHGTLGRFGPPAA